MQQVKFLDDIKGCFGFHLGISVVQIDVNPPFIQEYLNVIVSRYETLVMVFNLQLSKDRIDIGLVGFPVFWQCDLEFLVRFMVIRMDQITGFEMIEYYSGNRIDYGHSNSQITKIAMECIVPSP